ncbi:MAG: hypothetical protein CL674_04260 [Bdellovibrionaceae bacterium]|nr:hypothetical protein [Pseudobdellovibrionaceae bacterium]|tara:strand:+ start:81617 stop:82267 length:651 start_codon:yes stop_codon:yes gene_type:complete
MKTRKRIFSKFVALTTAVFFSLNLAAHNLVTYDLEIEEAPGQHLKMTWQGDLRSYEYCSEEGCEFLGQVPNFIFTSNSILESSPDPSWMTKAAGGALGSIVVVAVAGVALWIGVKLKESAGPGSQGSPNTGVSEMILTLLIGIFGGYTGYNVTYESFIDWVEQKELSVHEAELLERTLVKIDQLASTGRSLKGDPEIIKQEMRTALIIANRLMQSK